jgi:hypothetical protein
MSNNCKHKTTSVKSDSHLKVQPPSNVWWATVQQSLETERPLSVGTYSTFLPFHLHSFATLPCACVYKVLRCISCFQNTTVWFKTTCPTQSSSVRGHRVAVAGELGPRNVASCAMQYAECGSMPNRISMPNLSKRTRIGVRRPCLCWSHQLHEITRTGTEQNRANRKGYDSVWPCRVWCSCTWVWDKNRQSERLARLSSLKERTQRIDWVWQNAENRFVRAFGPTGTEPGIFWNGQLHLHSKLQIANPA